MNFVKLNGRKYECGEFVTLNHRAPSRVQAPIGTKVELFSISKDGSRVSLYSPHKHIDGWSDLSGKVKNGHGWCVKTKDLSSLVDRDDRVYEIGYGVSYRGKNLKGKLCKVVADIEDNMAFVELQEHVGGCSADGLGKMGHCVAIPNKSLRKKFNKPLT